MAEQLSVPLKQIEILDAQLEDHFAARLMVDARLTRSIVSFQANKSEPIYRWYKYKEAFSASLVDYLFRRYQITQGPILDPFAGSGTALFAARDRGIDADGIELLAIGREIILARQLLESQFTDADFDRLRHWSQGQVWQKAEVQVPVNELRITRGAYPAETEQAIERYLGALAQEDWRVRAILRFALLCTLEAISYTRKDGQYLRWDARSERKLGGKAFNKGPIPSFEQAISQKIDEIVEDMNPSYRQGELFQPAPGPKGSAKLLAGSCLTILPTIAGNYYEAIMTSPPYCNRYDYTRTYALELALLGITEKELVDLRQAMLSCTVENRAKDLLAINAGWQRANAAADQQELLQVILQYLESLKGTDSLNNAGIPRMVRGYFYEMACVIAECYRVLKPGGLLFMVNDNVRYAGASISVDLILSSIAETLGFEVERILHLPNEKGNSSQQMGDHGRAALRKCVYVWRKPV